MRPFRSLPLLLLSCLAVAQAAETRGVSLELIAENKTIAAGQPFQVGLSIRHEKDFHTYWKNPGVAGVPVSLEWDLPEGFSAGPIQWPVPEKTWMAIHPVHGYERDVTLLVEIVPPAEIESREVELKAAASWMACADGCFPGRKDLTLRLPVGPPPAAASEHASAFAAARAEIPKPLRGWSVEVLSPMDSEEIRIRFTPAEGAAARPEGVYFFSSDGQISSAPEQKIVTLDGGAFEIYAPRAQYSPKKQARLPGVVTAATALDGEGNLFASVDPAYPDAPAKDAAAVANEKPAAPTEDCGCEK